MVEPISTSLLFAKPVVTAVSDYISARVKLAAEAPFRYEQMAVEQQRHERTLAHQQALAAFEADRADRRAAAETARRETEDHIRRLAETYPIVEGPGTLREALSLDDDPGDPPLVVLIAPLASEDAAGATWDGLRNRVQDDLLTYGDQLRSRLIDRPFQWPHHNLYTWDLYDLPALILQISLASRRLTVRLGGCHLGQRRADDPRPVTRLDWPTAEDWTDAAIEHLTETSRTRTRFPVRSAGDEESLRELNHELASRVITLCVVTAMDAYYLTRRVAYEEQLDDAIVAAGVLGDDWPDEIGIPESQLADPAFHALHRAERALRRADFALAEIALADALKTLGDWDDAPPSDPGQLLDRAVSSWRMLDHHRARTTDVITAFPPDTPWRSACLDRLADPIRLTAITAPIGGPAATTPALTARGTLEVRNPNIETNADIARKRRREP